MKKVGLYFVVAIISVAIFLLGFSYETPIQPYTAYQVYLNGELLGMIDSKQELEDYINSQGSTIKANVQDYQKKLEIIDVVEELFKSIADEEFVNLSIKYKVHYLIDHKTGLKISDIKTDNLIKYLEDGYDAYSEEEINEMRDYVEKNEIYLFADKVYTPNGIDIKG